ncbi:uncharacterized protein LOC115442354 [Manduca sexta]|uniref:uncharacterized protein LOC115442354 n=1 Tax=Manduca sexta TaxID=7130 RepID=UPI00188FA03D|nr:uncharacterized protein LOC115442354 [Manduca sexta]
MQITRLNFGGKTRALTSAARDASCSRGWVRVVVQTVFALITVTSFILIVMMAMQNNSLNPITRPTPTTSRCHINICQVICNEAPYFGLHENEIIFAVVTADATCERISLTLNNPSFINSVLPANWLFGMRASHIHELLIHGGNLKYITPGAFTGHFAGSIHNLILKDITIESICDNSFIGLFNLENLYIKDSKIIRIEDDALRPVDGTLQSLTVTRSNHWNPVNVTGTTDFSTLTIVDLSYNDFGDIFK